MKYLKKTDANIQALCKQELRNTDGGFVPILVAGYAAIFVSICVGLLTKKRVTRILTVETKSKYQ